ncbi:1,3-beta-glucanosyltransferase NDAI_0G03890 [Naumovozyma dairenensis CBS 421]|uniref:1,3-beta-glucanosyltransferase n=1 Tax=Naumovozyma dairenensis (strain ATCC 10597 / BCRC 20456 / CBS 421 / NBRC 0211 / NRRL Y-12639) TaxID=1071378 RepID=G0WEF5_NAUDC|nr:hypothetical protein NDAI_0G03890 [Naumovozyma dairenensis CBS 421]CCD26166.2 hypothetical protein NDAI_0G03890 [Naumovozyma dairenensis CBS 421]
MLVPFILIFINIYITTTLASINPIIIKGKRFYDAVTNERFFIRGIDYQPGGSSEVNDEKDPLSDPDLCARDILLFQDLGINTVRIYSINPDLNHDKCMTLLATAGIYLILDVNSPLENQHLNRYEPWTTYNTIYLKHVFSVIDEFLQYNNTLGFFAGNEIVNDKRSAQYSPPYIKKLIGDMRRYIDVHSTRRIPVGYSAADDLKYRIPLSKYLECEDTARKDCSVDFYGVNSYQWCGQQTLESSGYDRLVEAYEKYSKPVIFSEFGCNKVLPRKFDEITALYSESMNDVFSGGLVYEFTQEPNNYGLAEVVNENDIQLLDDYFTLRDHYRPEASSSQEPSSKLDLHNKNSIAPEDVVIPKCQKTYHNIKVDGEVEENLADVLIREGTQHKKGKFVDLDEKDLECKFEIYRKDGKPWDGPRRIEAVNDMSPLKDTKAKSGKHGSRKKSSSFKMKPKKAMTSVFLIIVCILW